MRNSHSLVLFAALFVLGKVVFAASLSAQPKINFIDPISEKERIEIATILNEAADAYKRQLNFSIPKKTKIFVSGSPKNLALVFAKQRKMNAQYVPDKIKRYAELSSAEASYRQIYISAGSKRYPHNRLDRKRNLIYHELFHIYQYELVGPKSKKCCSTNNVPVVGPVWIFEGSADYYARVLLENAGRGRFAEYLPRIESSFHQNRPKDFRLLETRKGMDAVSRSYNVSAFAVHQLVTSAGLSSIPKFYSQLGRGKNWKRAFRDAFGLTPEEFYASL